MTEAHKQLQLSEASSFQRSKELNEQALETFRTQQDRKGEGRALFQLGQTHAKLKQPEVAIERFSQAIFVLEQLGDKANAAKGLSQLADSYAEIQKFDEARAAHLKAVKFASETEFNELKYFVLDKYGTFEYLNSKYSEAKTVFERTAEVARALKDPTGEAYALSMSAECSKELREFENARMLLNRAVELAGAANNENFSVYLRNEACDIDFISGATANALVCFEQVRRAAKKGGYATSELFAVTKIGHASLRLKRFPQALTAAEEAVVLAKQLGDYRKEGLAYLDAGLALSNLQKCELAIRKFDFAIERAKADRFPLLERVATTSQAECFETVGDIPSAIRSFERTVALASNAGDKNSEIQANTNLGMLLFRQNEFEKSLQYLERGLKIAREIDSKTDQHYLLRRIGEALYGSKQYGTILSKYTESATIAEKLGDKAALAESLERIGAFYIAVGQLDLAGKNYERSFSVATELGDLWLQADALVGSADVLLKQNDSKKSRQAYEKSLEIAKKVSSPYLEATSLVGLGILSRIEGKLDKSKEQLKKALEIATASGETIRAAHASNELANSYLESGDFEKAIEYSIKSLRESQKESEQERIAYSLVTIMRALYRQNRTAVSTLFGKQLVNLIQDARQKLKAYGEQTQQSFLNEKAPFYRELADILISQGRIAEAESVLAMLKEEEYFEFLRRDGTVSGDLLSQVSLTAEEKNAYDEYKKYADNLTALGKELGELQLERKQFEIGKFPKQARLDELEKQITNANVVFLAFLDKLKLSFGANDSRVGVLESGSQALLKELNEPRTVFISTISGEEKLNIVVTTSDVQKAYTVPVKSSELNKLVADFRSVLRNPAFDPRPAGKALYDKVFPAGLLKDLEGVKADTIVWSLDGTLRYIPISALWDGELYLVEKFNNVIITLASRDKIVAKSGERSKWNALGVGVSKKIAVTESDGSIRTFDALSAVPEELCSVVSDPTGKTVCPTTAGAMSGKMLLDEAFTLKNFKDSLGRFPVVHIASHFSLNAGNETDSYLLLGGGEDRRFTLASIRQSGTQFVGVDLLTLSACNTGMSAGNKSNGIEVEGFGVLAQRSGAKSVLASLWAVSDSSTRDLMINFYRNLDTDLASGKATALRKAQMSLLKGKLSTNDGAPNRASDIIAFEGDNERKPFTRDPNAPYAHPYYWSPFVLIGNWR